MRFFFSFSQCQINEKSGPIIKVKCDFSAYNTVFSTSHLIELYVRLNAAAFCTNFEDVLTLRLRFSNFYLLHSTCVRHWQASTMPPPPQHSAAAKKNSMLIIAAPSAITAFGWSIWLLFIGMVRAHRFALMAFMFLNCVFCECEHREITKTN